MIHVPVSLFERSYHFWITLMAVYTELSIYNFAPSNSLSDDSLKPSHPSLPWFLLPILFYNLPMPCWYITIRNSSFLVYRILDIYNFAFLPIARVMLCWRLHIQGSKNYQNMIFKTPFYVKNQPYRSKNDFL